MIYLVLMVCCAVGLICIIVAAINDHVISKHNEFDRIMMPKEMNIGLIKRCVANKEIVNKYYEKEGNK